jgi:hypothetical protein
MIPTASRPALLGPLFRRTLDVWTLESRAFLLYGLFMLTAGLAAGQLPVVGMAAALAVGGPMGGGLVLATMRVLQEERPGRDDFLGGFQPVSRLAGLAMLAILPAILLVAAWLALSLVTHHVGGGSVALALAGLFLAPVLVASVLWTVALPALVLEGGSLRHALGASVRLVLRRPLAVALVEAVALAANVLISFPAVRDLAANAQPSWQANVPFLLGAVLLGPLQGILTTLLYLRLREEETTLLGEA